MKRRKILIAAGGTGGHLFPAQQLAERLLSDCSVCFAGHNLSENPFFQTRQIPFFDIAAAAPKRGNLLSFFGQSGRGLFQALFLLLKERPDVVVGFGSYHSFPILLAAILLRKKIALFEANAVLGKVNRYALPFAKAVALQFPVQLKKGVHVPFLPWVEAFKQTQDKAAARNYFGLESNRLTFLVFGGSQGALFLNEKIPEALAMFSKQIQVIHLAGKERDLPEYSFCPSCVKAFESHMAVAYAAADFAICRSGAGTIAELLRYKIPALLIPFPLASEDHQKNNAQFLAQAVGGALLLLQSNASKDALVASIDSLIRNESTLRAALEGWKKPASIHFDALIRHLAEET